MSTDTYREKLQSLHFRTRKAGPKITIEGDHREGTVVTEDDQKQSVNVFIPPVSVEMDLPMVGELKEEAADLKADETRKAKVTP